MESKSFNTAHKLSFKTTGPTEIFHSYAKLKIFIQNIENLTHKNILNKTLIQ